MSNEVATVNPTHLLTKYEDAFTAVLPSHIDGNQWMNVALGILRSKPEITQAAANDPGRFLFAMHSAARLGLEPGTDEFYLVPFAPKKGQPRVILGIPGYQGLVELMYRAGAVESVIVECVYANDTFEYVIGQDSAPRHHVDWLSGTDRGPLRVAYAYAHMRGGATSKVVVLTKPDIDRIKKSSQGSHTPYSPWTTNEASMWLKSAARQLAKWVPTSAEYRREQLRDAQMVADAHAARDRNVEVTIPSPNLAEGEHLDELTGEILASQEPETEPGQMFAEADPAAGESK